MKESRNRIKKFSSREKGRCPKNEMLASIFLTETSRAEKFKLMDHIMNCDRCRTEFAILKEIWEKGHSLFNPEMEESLAKATPAQIFSVARQEMEVLVQNKKKRRRGKIFPLKTASLATASFAAVLIIFIALVDRHHPVAVERNLEPDTFQILEPWNSVAVRPIIFRWTPVSESKEYTLEILDSSLEIIYRKESIASTSFELPDNITLQLLKSKTYFWKVIAVLGDGKTVESEFGKFQITGI